MRALVTGGAGFVGTNLIKRLLRDGYQVVSLDNYSTGLKENEQEGCKYFDVDISEVKDFSEFMDSPDVIFHTAALARIQPSLENPSLVLKNNFMSTVNILEYARNQEKQPQIIFSGSSSFHYNVYGSPYAWSKFSGEQLCKLYSNVFNLNTCICRFYNVYGPHQIIDGEFAAVIGIFEKQYQDGDPLTVTGDGEQRRDFTHVDDIVDGLVRCYGNKFEAEVFELGRGENFSINEIADMFKHKKIYIPPREGEYPETLCKSQVAKDILNWKPSRNIDEYIEQWLEENKWE
mgnify:CR=1 FL=1